MLQRRILVIALLLIASRPAVPAAESGPTASLLYTVAKTYEPLAWLRGGERLPSGAAVYISDANGHRPLLPDFAASADPSVSFDGKRVLIAAKRHASDPWQIWELNLEEGSPHQITFCPENCIRPFYLPDDRVIYAREIAGRFVIEAKELGSDKTLVLTYLSSSAIPTDILRDGRILFESNYPLGVGDSPEIYTVYSDGSGVESYRCDHGIGRHSARQHTSGETVVASSHGLAKFTSARAEQVRLSTPAGEYAGDIAEISDGEWLLAWRPDAKSLYRLMRWIPGGRELKHLLAEPGLNVIQPVLIAPRTVPNRHPSGLHDWPNANLLCLNAYTSKRQLAPGSIQSIRLYVRDQSGHPKLLGTAPVERDGSFFVQVPSEQPIQFELVDAGGKTLQRENGYFWMRRGEQRICVGCHAGPETAPENAVPQILLKSTIPANLTGSGEQPTAGGH